MQKTLEDTTTTVSAAPEAKTAGKELSVRSIKPHHMVKFLDLMKPEKPYHFGKCWEWRGRLTKEGYGISTCGLAHRVCYVMRHGFIPKGMLVCHKCDNRKCVNPFHLYLGTHADNARDVEIRGASYHVKGENNGRSKLTEDDVRTIKQLYRPRTLGRGWIAIAKMFRVSPSTIRSIVEGVNWRHVT